MEQHYHHLFQTENPKSIKICSKCNNTFPENVNFCYFDGSRLSTANEQPSINSDKPQSVKSAMKFKSHFSGFEIPISHQNQSAIPIDLIQTTTNLLMSSPKMPVSIKNVKNAYWSIPAPKKDKKPFLGWFDHVGLSRTNLMSYSFIFGYVAIIYAIWFYGELDSLAISLVNPSLIITGFIMIIIITSILVLPVITLGHITTNIVQSERQDYQLKIDPTLFFLTLLLNVIIYSIEGPIPIILLPAEIKLRGLPPKKNIASGITKGVLPGIILTFTIAIVYFVATIDQWTNLSPITTLSPLIIINLKLLLVFSTGIIFLVMLPFGNALGRLVQEYNKKTLLYIVIIDIPFIIDSIIFSNSSTSCQQLKKRVWWDLNPRIN